MIIINGFISIYMYLCGVLISECFFCPLCTLQATWSNKKIGLSDNKQILCNKKYIDEGIVYLNDLLFSLDNKHSFEHLSKPYAVSKPTRIETSRFQKAKMRWKTMICNLQYFSDFHISGKFHQAQSHVDSIEQINKIYVMYTLRKMVSSMQAIL